MRRHASASGQKRDKPKVETKGEKWPLCCSCRAFKRIFITNIRESFFAQQGRTRLILGQPVATSGTAHVASCTKKAWPRKAQNAQGICEAATTAVVCVCACGGKRSWWRAHLRTLLGKISRRHPRKQTHPGRSCSLVCKTAVFVSLPLPKKGSG